jgi:hypothetical protein
MPEFGIGTIAREGVGSNCKVYAVLVTQKAYNIGYKKDDILGVLEHECRHALQNIGSSKTRNRWQAVDKYYNNTTSSLPLKEADAYGFSLRSNFSWKAMGETSGSAYNFHLNYNASADALKLITGLGADALQAKAAAISIMQEIYDNLPFIELKRNDYYCRVRPPPPEQ